MPNRRQFGQYIIIMLLEIYTVENVLSLKVPRQCYFEYYVKDKFLEYSN